MDGYEIALTLIESEIRSGAGLAAAKNKVLALQIPAEAVDRAAAEILRRLKLIEDLEPAAVCEPYGPGWYSGPKATDTYWPAYSQHLKDKDWTDEMVGALDATTSRVTSMLGAPGNPTISTKGLVVGRVQSGKTGNYTGVIAKAADSNYRFFIVLTGMTNSLRLQTQKRLEKDLTRQTPGAWTWLTKSEIYGDFGDYPAENINVALGASQGRTIAVVKKNGSVLKRLNTWISGGNELLKRQCPVLLIDDEADQASVSTSKTLDPDELKTINRRIVEMLGLLPKIAYVGYTATPFANVLIDPRYEENLYPRSFILSLPTPKNYFGAERIFGRDIITDAEDPSVSDGLPLIRTVEEDELKHLRPSSNAAVQGFKFLVTASLDDAIRYFYLATAARRFRESEGIAELDYSTMLVHTSQRVVAHQRALEAIVEHRTRALESLKKSDVQVWKSLWVREMDKLDRAKLETPLAEVEFEELLPFLQAAVADCKIIVSNGDPNQESNVTFEEKGEIKIVIGGNTLSRGLTLEGLTVSFFVRTSNAYDTILQMGRWFGYRDGYEDLPRVWMTKEMEDNFYDLATIEHEFREDLEKFRFGRTPAEVGARIRKHPRMRITAANKMRWAVECQTSYGGERVQTIYFKRSDGNWLLQNLGAAKRLFAALGSATETKKGRTLWRGVNVAQIQSFIGEYNFHERSRDLNRGLISDYIAKQNAAGGLKHWNVVLMGRDLKKDELGTANFGVGLENVALINRSRLKVGDLATANIKALMSTPDVIADQFDKDAGGREIDKLFEARKSMNDADAGVLLIYPISKFSKPAGRHGKDERLDLDAVEHVIGLAMVFPAPKGATGAEAYVTAEVSPILSDSSDDDVE